MLGISPETRVILVEEFRRQIRRRSWQFLTLLVPLVLLLTLIIVPVIREVVGDDEQSAPLDRIGYVDDSGIILNLAISDGPIQFADRAAGAQALQRGDVEAVFVVTENYLETGEVQWMRSSTGFLSDDSLADLWRDFMTVELIAGLVEPRVLERVISPANFTVYEVDEDGRISREPPDAQQAGEFFVPLIFAFLLIFAIMFGSGSLLQSVADEKENRMIEMIITSATPLSIMAGKVFALGVAGLIQVGVWVASVAIFAPLIIDQIPNAGDLSVGPGLLVTVVLLFLSGYFLFAVIMAGMGAATTSVREASQVSAIITIPAVIPVWFSSLIVADPDGGVAQTLSYIPITAPTTILIRLSSGSVSTVEIAASLLTITASALVLLWVSSKVFRAGLLLYGQRMSIKNVWAALRDAD